MNEIQAQIRCYPDETGEKEEHVTVRSHWNMSDRVHIKVGGREVIVIVKDLCEAAQRCARWR